MVAQTKFGHTCKSVEQARTSVCEQANNRKIPNSHPMTFSCK